MACDPRSIGFARTDHLGVPYRDAVAVAALGSLSPDHHRGADLTGTAQGQRSALAGATGSAAPADRLTAETRGKMTAGDRGSRLAGIADRDCTTITAAAAIPADAAAQIGCAGA